MRFLLFVTTALVVCGVARGQAPIYAGPQNGAIPVVATGGTVSVSLGNWMSYPNSVTGFGALLSGTTDDSSAFNLARINAGTNGFVTVPPGGVDVLTQPTGGSSGPILWKFTGNSYGTGSYQVNYFGGDEVETFYNGGLALFKSDTLGTSPNLRIDNTFPQTAATVSASVVNDEWVNEVIPAPTTGTLYTSNYVWADNCQLSDAGIGAAQNVCSANTVTRPAISDAYGPRSKDWVMFGQFRDQTGLPSSQGGPAEGEEIDLFANDADDGGSRVIEQLVIGKYISGGVTERVKNAILLNSNDATSYVGYAFNDTLPWDTAGINLSAGPLTSIFSTSQDQGGAGTTLVFGSTSSVTDNRVEVGMLASSGAFIPSNDAVVSVSNGTVTLATATNADVPNSSSVTFTSRAPALSLPSQSGIAFDGTTGNSPTHILTYGSGSLVYRPNGILSEFILTDSGTLTLNGGLITPLISDSGSLTVSGATTLASASVTSLTDSGTLSVTGASTLGTTYLAAATPLFWDGVGGARKMFYNTGNFVYQVSGVTEMNINDTGIVTARNYYASGQTALGTTSLSNCGSAGLAISTGSTDSYGAITPGTGATGCTLLMQGTHTAGMQCSVFPESSSLVGAYVSALGTSSLSVSFTTAGKFGYLCQG